MADVKVSALTALTGANLANGDQFLVTDVGSPNVSKSITADELAQGSQFSSRYQAIAGDRIWVDTTMLDTRTATPSRSSLFNGQAWYLDQSTVERVSTNLFIPSSWTTFDVTVYVANTTSSSGDVVMEGIVTFAGVDETIASSAPTTSVTITIGSTGVVKTGALLSAVSNTSTKLATLVVGRKADAAGDTLANDVGLLGVLLTRAS